MKYQDKSLLIKEDNTISKALLTLQLKKLVKAVFVSETEKMQENIKNLRPHLILYSLYYPFNDELEMIRPVLEEYPHIPKIVIVDDPWDFHHKIKPMGIFDGYIERPVHRFKLRKIISKSFLKSINNS